MLSWVVQSDTHANSYNTFYGLEEGEITLNFLQCGVNI